MASQPTDATDLPTPTRPGDEAPEDAAGSGENVCPACGGSGRIEATLCAECDGTGKVTTGIGGG